MLYLATLKIIHNGQARSFDSPAKAFVDTLRWIACESSTYLKHFLAISSPSATNSSILWETSKAYARGLIICNTATKRRKVMEQHVLLEKRLSISVREYLKRPTATKLKEVTASCATLDSLLTKKAGEKLGYAKQRLFEHTRNIFS